MAKAKRAPVTRETAEAVAIQALAFLAADPERLGRFLALSGLGPERIRAAAHEPGFLAGVLDHIAADESLLMVFAEHARASPAEIQQARAKLAGAPWERDLP